MTSPTEVLKELLPLRVLRDQCRSAGLDYNTKFEAVWLLPHDMLPKAVQLDGINIRHHDGPPALAYVERKSPTDEQRERLIEEAKDRIAHAFEGEGQAWWDDTSGDHLARVAAEAVAHMLLPTPEERP